MRTWQRSEGSWRPSSTANNEGEQTGASRVVELRHFAGLAIGDAAAALGLSRAAAYRHWTYARAWLRDAVSRDESG
jgi:hypothetical protein